MSVADRQEPLPSMEAALALLEQLAGAVQGVPAAPEMDGGSARELVIAEARYRALVEQIPAITFMASLEGRLNDIYISPQIEAMLGFTQVEWTSDPVLWYRQLHPEDRQRWSEEFARGCLTGGPFRAECRFLARDGSVVWVHGEARIISDQQGRPVLLQGVAFDITETKRAEEVVRASLREKEVLLKEVHHRVKNNLQITSSLLRLQAHTITDERARGLLRDSEDRVRSIALVHEMLYRSPDLARIDFGHYVRSLLSHVMRSGNLDARRVSCTPEIQDIVLEVDVAVPCGLIVNELTANALKHAFPGDRRGTIRVQMTAEGDQYRLSVADDGRGFPPEVSLEHAPTLGLRLVKTLVDQLGGRIEIRRGGGTEIVIHFPRVVAG